LPVTEDVAEREVTLPLYPALRDADVVLVAKAVQEAEVALPTENVSRTLD
jgi:dTDP-4-amino-4,6-dideoxygalactose transaminase